MPVYVRVRPHIHREKRKFLRTALKELAVVFTDQPGLLGPKVQNRDYIVTVSTIICISSVIHSVDCMTRLIHKLFILGLKRIKDALGYKSVFFGCDLIAAFIRTIY